MVSSHRYHPYGQTAQRTGAKPVYGFAGGEIEEEEELGLVQFRARWYAPEVGRWVSADPLFLESPQASMEKTLESGLYSYVTNNPVNGIDPSGLSEHNQTSDESDTADDFENDAMMNEELGGCSPDEPLAQAAGHRKDKAPFH